MFGREAVLMVLVILLPYPFFLVVLGVLVFRLRLWWLLAPVIAVLVLALIDLLIRFDPFRMFDPFRDFTR